MHRSTIQIHIDLDADKMPEHIAWQAPDGGVDDVQEAKGMLLGLWDGQEKGALRIDLWTKKMMVDEMADFMYQSLMGMADTYQRATRQDGLATELKAFARSFHAKAIKAIEEETGKQ